MTKPVITTRAGKGSALTWTEGDTNLTNLRDATITITADTGGTSVVSDLNGAVTLIAGTNVTITGDNTAKTVTINSTASGGATTLDGLTDVVITAAATNDALIYNGTNWVDTALSGITVGTASVGSTVTLTADNTTNATNYPLFANAATGNLSPRTDTGYTYNPSTGTLTATSFTGSLTGNASSATYASAVTLTADNTTAATNYPLFANAATGNLSPRTDTGFTYNPSTGILTSTGFAGALNGTVGATTASTGAFTTLSASSTVSGTGFSTYLASPPAIGGTAAAAGTFTTLTSTIATGTAPFTVSSTTKVTNLNVEQVDGYHADTANTVSTIAVRDSSGIITASGFAGALNGTVGATTASTGAFTTLSTSTSASLKAINEGALYDLGTTGGTIAPNVANGNVQKITLNSALTINAFTSPVAGQTLTLIIYGGTSYTSITSTMKFAGGIKTLTGTASCIDILSVYYDGTNYFASLGKGFA